MKIIKLFITSIMTFILIAMILKFNTTGDAYFSLQHFIDNLPPLNAFGDMEETLDDFQNLINYVIETFTDGFEFSDLLDVMVALFKFFVYLVKFLLVDLLSDLLDIVLWIFKVFKLAILPTNPIITPFDKELLI